MTLNLNIKTIKIKLVCLNLKQISEKIKFSIMSTERIFQFSSFENKEQEERLKLMIKKLGAAYDESKVI